MSRPGFLGSGALVVAVALGCGLGEPGDAPRGGDMTDEATTWLWSQQGRDARYAPVLAGESPRVGDPVALEGVVADPDDPPVHAAEGDTLAVARTDGQSWTVHLRRGDQARDIPLGTPQPASVAVVHGAVLVGHARGVHRLEPDAVLLRSQQVVDRELMFGKAYDLMVRDGDRVLAVDDIMRPYYADLLRVDPDGDIEVEVSGELPGLVNGHYAAGAMADGVAWLVAPYGIMSGHGHHLYRVEVAGLDDERGPYQASGQAVLQEHVPRPRGGRGDEEPRLLAGEAMSGWTAVAVVGRHLVLAARERGILVADRADPIGGGVHRLALGDVLDVVGRGDTGWALVREGEAHRLVPLRPEGEGLGAGEAVALEGRWDGLLP